MPTKIEQPYLVICEAQADKNTFLALINHNTMPNIFQFDYPLNDEDGHGGGKGGFWHVLLALPLITGAEDLRGIILLQDTDDSPMVAFKELRNQLRRVNKEQAGSVADIATKPNDFLTPFIGGFLIISNKKIPILFASVPFGKPGCLETLILPSVEKAYPEYKNCLDRYETCCNIDNWPVTKQHKMRLACLIATICQKDPTCSVSNMWSTKHKFRELLTDQESFGEIIDFFKNIEQMCLK